MRRPARCASTWGFVLLLLTGGGLPAQQPAGSPPAAATDPHAASAASRFRLGGLLQLQAEAGDRGNRRFTLDDDRIYLRRARLSATGAPFAGFDVRLEVELANSLANDPDLRVDLTDGFVDWRRFPRARLRVGQFKTPFGFEQLFGDPRLPVLERSLANDRLTLGRQIGAQVGGEVRGDRLSYALGVFNGGRVDDDPSVGHRPVWVGRLSGTPWRGRGASPAALSLGGDAYLADDVEVALSPDLGVDGSPETPAPDGRFRGERRGLAVDAQLLAGRFELWAEALQVRFTPRSQAAPGVPAAGFEATGGYLQGSYFVLPDRLQVLAKLDTFDRGRAGGATDIATLGATYLFRGHDLKLAVNYLRIDDDRTGEQDEVLARLQLGF